MAHIAMLHIFLRNRDAAFFASNLGKNQFAPIALFKMIFAVPFPIDLRCAVLAHVFAANLTGVDMLRAYISTAHLTYSRVLWPDCLSANHA